MIGNKPIASSGTSIETNILLYKVGEVITEPTIRNYKGRVYLLNELVAFPFTCADFHNEFVGGKWMDVIPPEMPSDVCFINSSQYVSNAMHDKILIFTGNYTLTFAPGLRSDFKTVVTADNSAKGNFAFRGTTNSSESDGSILTSGGMCSIFQTTTNTFRLKGGGLS